MLQTLPSNRVYPAGSAPPVTGAYTVDISRGERIGRVSSEWFSRPDDERYLSLSALHAEVRARADRASARTVETRALHVEASRDNAERMALIVPGRDEPIPPTHWSFGQMCSLVGAPAGYLRQLNAPLAAINMQHGLLSHRAELIKTLEADDGRLELRAVTGSDYGRIWDHELVSAVMKIAGNGVGDTRWKVPGLLDWSTMRHNPFVEVTKDTTTLYASDRDVFLFLVDDAHPIEAGRLPNGNPDLYFRGFYCWNSEVGSKTLGMASFFLRAVCMNRNIWGAEGFEEISIRHSKFAAKRFAHEAAPALENFANSSPAPFLAGIKASRERIVARKDDDRESFLRKQGFSKQETAKIIATVLDEEGRPPESIFDFVQGITALARSKPHQDARLELEGKASKLHEFGAAGLFLGEESQRLCFEFAFRITVTVGLLAKLAYALGNVDRRQARTWQGVQGHSQIVHRDPDPSGPLRELLSVWSPLCPQSAVSRDPQNLVGQDGNLLAVHDP